MEQVAAAPTADARRRTSIIVTSAIAIAVVAVAIIFAANTPWYFVFKMIHVGAAVVWVGGGLFLAICAVLAELARNDDQLLQVGYWAESVSPIELPAVVAYVRDQRSHHDHHPEPTEPWEAWGALTASRARPKGGLPWLGRA